MSISAEEQTGMIAFKHPPRLENGIRYSADITEDKRAVTVFFDDLSVKLMHNSIAPVTTKLASLRFPLEFPTATEATAATVSIQIEGIAEVYGSVRSVLAIIVNGNGHFVPLPQTAGNSSTKKEDPTPELLYTFPMTIDPRTDLFVTCLLLLETPIQNRGSDGTLIIDRISAEIQMQDEEQH